MWKELVAVLCLQFGAECNSYATGDGYRWPFGTYHRLQHVVLKQKVGVEDRSKIYQGKRLVGQSVAVKSGRYVITVFIGNIEEYFPELWVLMCRQPWATYNPIFAYGECAETTYSGYILKVRPVGAHPQSHPISVRGGSLKWRLWRTQRAYEFLKAAQEAKRALAGRRKR